jgi:ubiquinone/menaquinone biosynthesis C-methylase UbiE
MATQRLSDDFYEGIRTRLRRRIGRELRLARRVLDLGCGSCELVRYLAEAYRQQVTGVDVSSGSFPKRRRSRGGVRFRCIRRDATRLGFVADGSVDAIVMTWTLHEMDRPEAILTEARRVLRPGGEILVVDFPKGSVAQRLWNEDYYRPGEIRTLLERAEFEDVSVRLIYRGQVIWARGRGPAARTA